MVDATGNKRPSAAADHCALAVPSINVKTAGVIRKATAALTSSH